MHKRTDFYTAEPIEKDVSKEEFYEFIKSYPRKLNFDCCGICEPPAISYNDFELANRWPYSVVASTCAYSDNPEDWAYVLEERRRYTIVTNYEELFNSKTGFAAEEGE